MEALMSPKPELEKPEVTAEKPPTYGNSGFMGWFKKLKDKTNADIEEGPHAQQSIELTDTNEGILTVDTLNSPEVELTSEQRLFKIIEDFNKEKDRSEELSINTREAILSDSTHIENQEISFIDTRKDGHVEANLKLTQPQFEDVAKTLKEALNGGNEDVEVGSISYKDIDGDGEYTVCSAYVVNYKGLKVKVAAPSFNSISGDYEQRAAIGLVCIDIPYENDSHQKLQDIEGTLNDVMINVLGVPEGLSEPTEEAERQYKDFRYRWHHKIPTGPLTEEQSAELDKLTRTEVFPEYHTMVSPGKHKEYEEKFGEFASFHKIASTETLKKILQGDGTMSSHERFRRGTLLHGMSSSTDFDTGGADSVFVRTYVEDAITGYESEKDISLVSALLVFEPEIFDRTDWYAYSSDQYGRTSKEEFQKRQSPEELLGAQKDPNHGYISSNEQMFRTGIATEQIKAIASSESEHAKTRAVEFLGKTREEVDELWKKGPDAVRNAIKSDKSLSSEQTSMLLDEVKYDRRLNLIDELREQGLKEVNGKPIEQFIVAVKTLDDLVDIAHDREPRSGTKQKE